MTQGQVNKDKHDKNDEYVISNGLIWKVMDQLGNKNHLLKWKDSWASTVEESSKARIGAKFLIKSLETKFGKKG